MRDSEAVKCKLLARENNYPHFALLSVNTYPIVLLTCIKLYQLYQTASPTQP